MIIPKKCSNVDCDMYLTNKTRALQLQQARINKGLLDHIDAQSKIIANLTEQLRITTQQVCALSANMSAQLHTIADVD